MKAIFLLSLILVIGCVSNQKAGRSVANEGDVTAEHVESEHVPPFQYGTVRNPKWVVNTYVPEGSRFRLDPEKEKQQTCGVEIRKYQQENSGQFRMDINISCSHAIQSDDFEIQRCGRRMNGGGPPYRAVDYEYRPSEPLRPGFGYVASYGGLVYGPEEVYGYQGLYKRMVVELDPLTDQPRRLSVEYRQGAADQDFGKRALQALFTCEMNQSMAKRFEAF